MFINIYIMVRSTIKRKLHRAMITELGKLGVLNYNVQCLFKSSTIEMQY